MPITVLDEYPPGVPGGACFICRASRRPSERIVDMGLYADRSTQDILDSPEFGQEGRFAICGTCIEEAANGLGLLAAKSAERLAAKVNRLSEQLDEARIRADAAESALDSLRRYDTVAK